MSHDRGVATKAETHRAARWQGAGRGGRGAEPPSMVKARYHRSTGLRPPALRMSSSTPLSLTPLPTPRPASRRPLAWAWAWGSSGSVGASSAGAASSWTWPSMGATSPTAGGVCVSPVSLPSLRAWARACRRE